MAPKAMQLPSNFVVGPITVVEVALNSIVVSPAQTSSALVPIRTRFSFFQFVINL